MEFSFCRKSMRQKSASSSISSPAAFLPCPIIKSAAGKRREREQRKRAERGEREAFPGLNEWVWLSKQSYLTTEGKSPFLPPSGEKERERRKSPSWCCCILKKERRYTQKSLSTVQKLFLLFCAIPCASSSWALQILPGREKSLTDPPLEKDGLKQAWGWGWELGPPRSFAVSPSVCLRLCQDFFFENEISTVFHSNFFYSVRPEKH